MYIYKTDKGDEGGHVILLKLQFNTPTPLLNHLWGLKVEKPPLMSWGGFKEHIG